MAAVRAVYDLSPVPHALGGVSRYMLSLAGALRGVAPENGVELTLMDVPAAHPGVPGPGTECLSLPTPVYMKVPLLRRIPIRLGWEKRSRGSRIADIAGRPDIIHHSGVQPFAPDGAVSVVTVYDLSALHHPEWHTDDTVMYAERERDMLLSGAYAAVISSWTGSELRESLGLPEWRIRVIGGAADAIFTPGEPSPDILEGYGLKREEYLLHVGNFVPRKNIPFLVDVYRRSRRAGVSMPLVMVTSGGWGGVSVEEGDGVRILRKVDDRHMPHLYRGARALLCPSGYEGLGLPVLEALACGTPVIASDSSALPETLGGHGQLVTERDGDGWLAAIDGLRRAERTDELRRMAVSAPRRTWSDTAVELCEYYRSIAGR